MQKSSVRLACKQLSVSVFCRLNCYDMFCEVMKMSYIAPAVQAKFETLSLDLKNQILERDVQINDVFDLIRVLEEIVNEG